MKDLIINLLKSNENSFISGQKISEELGITRAAIWKYMNQIKEEGYEIVSVSRKGYMLINSPDLLTSNEIKNNLNTEFIGKNIIHFDSINSTNIKAKELAELGEIEGSIVISEEQTMGRGRLGRSWLSPKHTGIWISIILRPDMLPNKAAMITQVGAAAVATALKKLGITSYIKWPNDILVNGKKVCGILTEMSCELNQINYIIMGIGINVNQNPSDFPEELSNIATSIKIEEGKSFSRKLLLSQILNEFEVLYYEFVKNNNVKPSIHICKYNSILLGKEIKIINRGQLISVTALDIDDNGELIVEYPDGKIDKLISGEVSMHGLWNKS